MLTIHMNLTPYGKMQMQSRLKNFEKWGNLLQGSTRESARARISRISTYSRYGYICNNTIDMVKYVTILYHNIVTYLTISA